MAYRRRPGLSRSSTFKEEIRRSPDDDDTITSSAKLPHSGSDPRLDSFRTRGSFHSSFKNKASSSNDFTSLKTSNESRGFWSVLARKAKAILDDEVPQQSISPKATSAKKEPISFSTNNQFTGIQVRRQNESFDHSKKFDGEVRSPNDSFEHSMKLDSQVWRQNDSFEHSKKLDSQVRRQNDSFEHSTKVDSQALRIDLDIVASKLNQIGNNVGKALEADKKTHDISQETLKIPNMRSRTDNEEKKQNTAQPQTQPQPQPQPQRNPETQLQASRDVAIATAAKVKQLVRQLKTVKGELASTKERCTHLEDENKVLREVPEDGDYPADDDMIRVQLETLLAEKGRLAHENSVYARENRYLREIVEFHQLSMQDVVYLDEDLKELNLTPMANYQIPEEPSTPSSSRSA